MAPGLQLVLEIHNQLLCDGKEGNDEDMDNGFIVDLLYK